jgi:hypothetical protein
MAAPRRTQKQIAERYKGNLGYYNKKHPWRRARRWVSFIAIVGGFTSIVLFQMHGHAKFFSAGKISSNHAAFGDNCTSCHDKSLMTGGGLTVQKFREVVKDRFQNGIAFEPIDQRCETCHQLHAFHQANVVQNRSCSVCHQEHQGSGAMRSVASFNCASCHNNRETMAASAQKGMQLSPTAFHRHPHPAERVVLELPRPPRGYTQVFSSFWAGHPEFQLDYEKARDPDYDWKEHRDILRFNHQRHFAPDVPWVNGRKLDCNYCHKPDAEGRYYQRITFAANCQACHSLQFDAKNPDLKIPHGDVTLARTFLRTLPAQYGDYARLKKGKTRESEAQEFVSQQIRQLREQFRTGEELERAVFFTSDPYKPQRQMGPGTRANFAGCAFCHEVKPVANAAPLIPKPILVDRWMPQARFDHAKHASVKCDDCHHATQSRETVDVLMPAKANCVTCHSPAGKVVAECITCHTYHSPPEAMLADAHSPAVRSLKQMLLGR